MNVSAAHWAFAHQIQPVSTKFVLITLACFASRKWLVSISVPDLIEKTGLHRRAIFMALAELKTLGLIESVGFEGPKKIPIYSVKGCNKCTLGVQYMHSRGAINALERSLPSSSPPPEPRSSTLSLFPDAPPLPPQGGNGVCLAKIKKARKTKLKETEPSEDFLTFWDAYPRKQKMKDAWKAWQQMNPPLSIVLESLAEHKKTEQWRRGKQFIPYPGTWIRGEQWDDEL